MKAYEISYMTRRYEDGKEYPESGYYANFQNAMAFAEKVSDMEDVVGNVDVTDAFTGEVYASYKKGILVWGTPNLDYDLESHMWILN